MSVRWLFLLLALWMPAGLLAAEGVPASVEAAIRAQVGAAIKNAVITNVAATPIPGIFAIELDSAETAFVTADGAYLISGDLYQPVPGKGLVNVTDKGKGEQRSKAFARMDRSQLITFPAKGKEKSFLYVYTDVDCGYCRKMHQEITQLNDAGITVHYLAFPREGINSDTARKMEAVWCAKDRRKALTDSKQGIAVPPAPAICKSPVADQYRVGAAMGVRGTPAVYDPEGNQVGGYVAAAKLIEQLTRAKPATP